MALQKNEKGIISLAMVFVIGFLGLGMVLTMSAIALLGINKNANTNFGSQAFYTAESAVREGIWQFINNSFEGTDNFILGMNDIANSDISFAVSSSSLGWAYKEAEGNAENKLTNRNVKNTLILFPEAAAFDYAIYSKSALSIDGNPTIIGNIFSNNDISCNGTAHNIEGDAYSSGLIGSCNADSINPGVEIIPPPTIDPYYYGDPVYGGIADCTSTATDVGTDCSSYLSGFTNGVVFMDDPGNTAILNGANLIGNLTIIGNLNLGGNSIITASSDYAAVVVDGNLTMSGTSKIYGLVYVTGSVNFSAGTPRIYGSLISLTDTETSLAGNVIIEHVALSAPPGGLNYSLNPQIISWQEQ